MIFKLLKLATRLYWNDSRIGKTAWTNYPDPYPYNSALYSTVVKDICRDASSSSGVMILVDCDGEPTWLVAEWFQRKPSLESV